jgi:hypothetical protein
VEPAQPDDGAWQACPHPKPLISGADEVDTTGGMFMHQSGKRPNASKEFLLPDTANPSTKCRAHGLPLGQSMSAQPVATRRHCLRRAVDLECIPPGPREPSTNAGAPGRDEDGTLIRQGPPAALKPASACRAISPVFGVGTLF